MEKKSRATTRRAPHTVTTAEPARGSKASIKHDVRRSANLSGAVARLRRVAQAANMHAEMLEGDLLIPELHQPTIELANRLWGALKGREETANEKAIVVHSAIQAAREMDPRVLPGREPSEIRRRALFAVLFLQRDYPDLAEQINFEHLVEIISTPARAGRPKRGQKGYWPALKVLVGDAGHYPQIESTRRTTRGRRSRQRRATK